jgi:hypothetical protein
LRAPGGGFSLFARFVVAAALLALCAYLAFEAIAGWYCVATTSDRGCGLSGFVHTFAMAIAARFLWRLLRWDPEGMRASRAPAMPAGGASGGTIREWQDGTLPEPQDVPLGPEAGKVVEAEDRLNIEFPVATRVRGGVTVAMWLVFLGAIVFGGALKSVGTAVVLAIVSFPLSWFVYLSMREHHHKCTLEATPEGLMCCQGWGDNLSCRNIAKEEIDLLEPRPVLQQGEETLFEVAAILESGERIVIGENIPGVAIADTLTRKIGAALQLNPEQVLTAAGGGRRLRAPLDALLGSGKTT